MSPSSSIPQLALGEQPPRIRQAPDRCGLIGPTVVGTARKVGLALDPWQADTIVDAQSVDLSGRWLTPRVAVSVPRQNGKGAIIEAIELAFLLGVFPDAKLLIHSAHEFKTAQDGFRRLVSYFDSVPALAQAKADGRVKLGTAVAREFITIVGRKDPKTGRKIEPDRTVKFFARSKGSGRGFSADILILDEAQELSEQVWAAILPTVSARPNPQIWLFGTPPDPTMNGEVFTRFREGAIKGGDARLAYFEWSASKDDDFASPATWAKANPAFGMRIDEEGTRDEFNSMDEETFCRERLGMWDDAGGSSVIPEDTWAALVSDSDPVGRVVFALDVSPDRSRASIGVAGYVAGDRVMVQAIENRKGTGWVVPRLVELTKRWPHMSVILDSGGPAASLLPDLKRLGVKRVVTFSTREVAQSCGSFYDAAMNGTLAHPDQPVLNEALASARKRVLGDAWAWHRKNATTDITPLVAVTFAAYGLAMKRNAAQREPSRALIL